MGWNRFGMGWNRFGMGWSSPKWCRISPRSVESEYFVTSWIGIFSNDPDFGLILAENGVSYGREWAGGVILAKKGSENGRKRPPFILRLKGKGGVGYKIGRGGTQSYPDV